jgi:hypothetical protein
LGFFSGGLPTEPCALGSTQPLKLSPSEGGRCVELTTNHPSSAERQEIRGLNLPGPPRAAGGLLREYLYIYFVVLLSVSVQKYSILFHLLQYNRRCPACRRDGICGGQSGTGKGFSPSILLLLCQYQSNNVPYSSTYYSTI